MRKLTKIKRRLKNQLKKTLIREEIYKVIPMLESVEEKYDVKITLIWH